MGGVDRYPQLRILRSVQQTCCKLDVRVSGKSVTEAEASARWQKLPCLRHRSCRRRPHLLAKSWGFTPLS